MSGLSIISNDFHNILLVVGACDTALSCLQQILFILSSIMSTVREAISSNIANDTLSYM